MEGTGWPAAATCRIVSQRCRLEGLEADVEAQAAAIRRAKETAHRHGAEASSLETDALRAARACRDDRASFEALTAKLATVRSAEDAQTAEKRDLCRRIRTANLALGVKEANAARIREVAVSDVPSAHLSEPDAFTLALDTFFPGIPQLQRVKALRQQLQVLGDENNELTEEVAAEQQRRVRNREAILVELASLERQREELKRSLTQHGKTVASTRESIAGLVAEERKAKAETSELRSRLAAINGEGPREAADFNNLHHQLQGLAVADLELRERLRDAQEQLWQQERWERGG